MNSPFDTKQTKEYFKKNEFGVPSNLDKVKIDPSAQFEVEQVDKEDQPFKIEELNATAQNYPNHAFVSFLASVDIDSNV
jgi:UDP-N-acetylglucosamine pyrophosphorylase